jgi:hypothetical protein
VSVTRLNIVGLAASAVVGGLFLGLAALASRRHDRTGGEWSESLAAGCLVVVLGAVFFAGVTMADLIVIAIGRNPNASENNNVWVPAVWGIAFIVLLGVFASRDGVGRRPIAIALGIWFASLVVALAFTATVRM